ncbi:hypothetical protein BH11PSE13_BH11PSE13_07830 [soil metagenome]
MHRGRRSLPDPVCILSLDTNLHSLSRQLIDLRIEHADLDATIDRLVELAPPQDDLLLRRLKKRRLALRDRIDRVARDIAPQEPA